MDIRLLAALRTNLSPQVVLGKTRLETLCLLTVGMIGARTANPSLLAAGRPGHALVASTCRRLRRLFQHVKLPDDWSAAVVPALLTTQARGIFAWAAPIGRSGGAASMS